MSKMTDTSTEAYLAEQPHIQSQVERVKDFFRRYPTMSFSDSDLRELFHWGSNVVESRRSQLVRDGFIEAVGYKTNKATGHRVTTHRWVKKEKIENQFNIT